MKKSLKKLSPTTKSVSLILFTVFLFSLQDAIAKQLINDYPPIQVVWARYASQSLVTILLILPFIKEVLTTRNIKLQLVRSTFLFSATFCFFTSLKYLLLAEVNAIFQLAPLFVTALSFFILREDVGARRWAGILFGIMGALMIIRPGSPNFSFHMFLPAGAALFYASYLIATKYLSSEEAASTNFLYTSVVGAVIASILVPASWVPVALPDLLTFTTFGLMGALGHFFIIVAFRIIDASFFAPFTYLQLVFGCFWGYYFFYEIPSYLTVLGGLLIVASGIYIWHRERERKLNS